MGKAVMISIRPKWCELIAIGEKTVEIRKTRPKLEPPFKCYIYCTLGKPKDPKELLEIHCTDGMIRKANGFVIGEFVCDGFTPYCKAKPIRNAEDIERRSCLARKEIWEYEPKGNPVGWHISDLVIYNKLKALSEFRSICNEYWKDDPQCGGCGYYHPMCEYPAECDCDGVKILHRPPQSWCYVEEVKG